MSPWSGPDPLEDEEAAPEVNERRGNDGDKGGARGGAGTGSSEVHVALVCPDVGGEGSAGARCCAGACCC